jgi:hypothetical protein
MSLDKSINHGKEKRKPYRKSKAFDKSCRPNGGCPYCAENRKHGEKKRKAKTDQQIKEYFDLGRKLLFDGRLMQ